MQKMKERMKRAYRAYDRAMEKQGFYIVLGICVLVIVCSALYTFHFREIWSEEPEPALSVPNAQAGAQQNETLNEAQNMIVSSGKELPNAEPTRWPQEFMQPVQGFVDRDYSFEEPVYFDYSASWQIHPAIDIVCDYGTPVKCSAAGRVNHVWQDNEMGLCVSVLHGDEYETVYAGLSDASYVRDGDPVSKGQTIGHVGNGVLCESDREPHLHFAVRKNGYPVDPLTMLLGVYEP